MPGGADASSGARGFTPDDLHASARLVPYGNKVAQIAQLMQQSLGAHGLIWLVLGWYKSAFAALILFIPSLSAVFAPSVMLEAMFVIGVLSSVILIAYKFVEMAVYEAPDRPILHFCRNLYSVVCSADTWTKGLPMFLGICLFMAVFVHIKAGITLLQPFAWDETFDRWDAALHFGYRPWEWLHPIVGHPLVTFAIDLNYKLWFFVLVSFWMHYCFCAEVGEARTRFFLSFMLTWMIGGSLLAVLLSSAGPCYFGEGGLGISPDPYAGLMAYLNTANNTVPLSTLLGQDVLWTSVGQTRAFGGISAMPSMHNATVLLFLLASRGFPRWLRLLLILHFILVFIGSIHLAWHYAVDAYIAWIITLGVWYVAGPISRWWENRPAARAFSLALELRRET